MTPVGRKLDLKLGPAAKARQPNSTGQGRRRLFGFGFGSGGRKFGFSISARPAAIQRPKDKTREAPILRRATRKSRITDWRAGWQASLPAGQLTGRPTG